MNVTPEPPRDAGGPDAEALRRRLAQAERLLACFQKAVGHELPNQLVAIQGLAQVLDLEEGERLSPDGREYLTRLAAAARRTHTLVRALADVGRAWRDRRLREPVALEDEVREAVAQVNQLSSGHPVEYHFSELTTVLTVPRLALRQVLVQLLKHAVQAAPDGRTPRVTVGARRTEAGAEFWVAGDSPGTPSGDPQDLFEPFAPGTGPTTGNGLGLFLVRLLVEDWGGSVHIQSVPGQCLTILVRSP